MKIISKFKDYYDYLAGVWGVDEKLVLDRTKFTPKRRIGEDYEIITFHICGTQYQGMWMDGEVLYGDELIPFMELDYKTGRPRERLADPYYHSLYKEFEGFEHMWSILLPSKQRQTNWKTRYILKQPLKHLSPTLNDLTNCPIILGRFKGDEQLNPILKEYNFHKVLSAEAIWQELTTWLASKHEEIIQDTRTNKEKILSNGFDLKTSFRH